MRSLERTTAVQGGDAPAHPVLSRRSQRIRHYSAQANRDSLLASVSGPTLHLHCGPGRPFVGSCFTMPRYKKTCV